MKNSKNSIKFNFIYNTAYQILAIILPLITAPYLAKTIGAAGVGTYSYHFSVAKYFTLFAMLGLSNYGNRRIAMVRDNEQELSIAFSSIFAMQLITTGLALFIYMIYAVSESNPVVFAMGLYVLSAVFDINWFFCGIEQFKLTVTRSILVKITSVLCIFLFVKDASDLTIYCFIIASSFLISQLVTWPYVRRYVKFTVPQWKNIRVHFKENLILFVPVIAVSLYKLMDKIMLGQMSAMQFVGFYENTEQVILVPIALIQSLGTVMLPRMSNMFAKGERTEGIKYINKSIVFATFLSSACSFGMMAVCDIFVPWFFGEEFLYCIPLFYILAPSTIFIAIANVVRTQYLIPTCADKLYITSVFLGALVNIVLNLLLIPKYNAVGAAIGTFFAEMSVCVYQICKVKKQFNIMEGIKTSIYFIVFGITMYMVVHEITLFFSSDFLILISKIGIGAVVYLFLSAVWAAVKYKNKA